MKSSLRIARLALTAALLLVSAGTAAAGTLAPVVVTVSPATPYQPGDYVWYSTPPASTTTGLSSFGVNSFGGVSPMANGCQRVPSTGYISSGVYANSTAEYANDWTWSAGSSSEPFYWYIKKTDNSTYTNGYSSGGGGDTGTIAANDYYWKVQNQGATPQAWNVCYQVI